MNPFDIHLWTDLYILYIASIFTFAVFAWDKHLAVFNKSRVPEFVLLLFSFLGGAFGALCAMIFFRHKTLHRSFLICVPLFVFMHLAIVIIYRVFIR